MGKSSKSFAALEDSSVYSISAAELAPMASSALFNDSFEWETTEGLPTVVSDLIGTDIRDNEVLPHGDNVPGTVRWQLDSGLRHDVSDGIITYGFATQRHSLGLNNNPSFGEGRGYTPFTQEQIDAARIAIANWDELIAATFVEVTASRGARDFGRQTTDIVLANTYTGPAQAWAYYPGYGRQYERIAGDVWIADPEYNSSNAQLDPGQYGLATLNHELGHALGLAHPGAYNFGDGTGEITYDTDAEYFQDSTQFTIMSYFDSYETGAQPIDWNVMRFIYPSTPMVDDVRVIQQIYGADKTTRTGDTTYGFNFTTDVTNEAMKFRANEMFTIFTIWDAGGIDTLDLSGYHTDSVIDLREGAYSSAGGWGAYDPALLGVTPTLGLINTNNGLAGLGNRTDRLFEIYFNGDWTDVAEDGTETLINEGVSWRDITGTDDRLLMEQNIGIAYGAVIENAVGGHGNDRINGNQVNNVLTGNAGRDTFIFVDDGSVDRITDFASGTDLIDLTEIDADRLSAGDAGFTFIGAENFTIGVAGQLRTYTEQGSNFLAGDTDGDGVADFLLNVGSATVVVSDILL